MEDGNGKEDGDEKGPAWSVHGEVDMVDFKFTDLPGALQHITYPVDQGMEKLIREGVGFDGSSIRGFSQIDQSDMMLKPDMNTAVIDPACKIPTLSVLCDIIDPIQNARFERDPRYIAQKAEAYLKETGIANRAYMGPEIEFFVLDSVRFDQNQHSGYYYVDSEEGIWNSGNVGNGNNFGHRPRHKEGYFPVPPTDSLQDFRSICIVNLTKAGIKCERHHHEVATAGQCEIGVQYQTLTKMADRVMMCKYILKNTANDVGKTITFMPKPLFQDNGSAMHVHQSLAKDDVNLFFDPDGYAMLSEMAMYYIGGLLEHSEALLALTNPSTNSYRRLVPGYEAPVNLVYSMRNRSAAIRVPTGSKDPKAKRIEYRPPDATSNPYLAFAAMLMAGLDGIKRRIHPGEPHDVDLYSASTPQRNVRTVPRALEDALRALESDHEFLLKGNVFTKDLLETWVDYKQHKESDYIRLRPHPSEFLLYFDV